MKRRLKKLQLPVFNVKLSFLNYRNEDANFASIFGLLHILASRKESAICPGVVFFLGSLTSVSF